MTKHLITCHKSEDAQNLVIITILEACSTVEEGLRKEIEWTHNLFAYRPTGLNLREEVAKWKENIWVSFEKLFYKFKKKSFNFQNTSNQMSTSYPNSVKMINNLKLIY